MIKRVPIDDPVIKAFDDLEEGLLENTKAVEDKSERTFDPRWTAVAKTHFEQGFMALRRAYGEGN